MAMKFSADEIFEMAIQAESNAYKMYNDLAEKHKDLSVSSELKKLAQMEKDHEEIFIEMRREIPEDMRNAVYDTDNQAALYLQSIADSEIAEGSPEVAARMTDAESFEDILKLAIDLEKGAILFYLGIRDMVPARFGKDKIEKIIREEQGHIISLSKRLKEISG